jgi:molecular chaperone HscB
MTTTIANPASATDYFGVFGLRRKLNLDTAKLEKDFYALSRKLHPDLFARASAEEREWSQEQSSRLNDAYRTLKDPIRRTEYLLKLEGVELEEQSKSATDAARATGAAKKQVVPPALLEEVFELNLQLEEMRMSKKMGEPDPELTEALKKQKFHLEQQFEALSGELRGYWNEWDEVMDQELHGNEVSEKRTQARGKLVDLLNRRNYYRNLVRDVNEVLES